MAEAKQLRLPMGMGSSRQFEPVWDVARGAARYARSIGRQYSAKGLAHVQADMGRVAAHTKAYHESEAQPQQSDQTRASYEALRQETNAQYDFMTKPKEEGGLGIQVEVTPDDPYAHPEDMAADLREGRIKVFSSATTGVHDYLSEEENDRLRAVHDVFGHGAIGRGFSRHGEEASWRSHRQMYSEAAQEALASEFRGKNSSVVWRGEFPENRLVGVPKFMQEIGPVPEQAPPKGPKYEQLGLDL